MEKRYTFHIQFADGSNPYYHFPCSYAKHIYAIRKWRRLYDLTPVSKHHGHVNFYATSRIKTPQVDLFRV